MSAGVGAYRRNMGACLPFPYQVAAALALGAATTLAGDAFPEGKSSFVLEKHGKTIPVMTYRPADFDDGPLILVLHGMDRNAGDYRDRAVPLGDRFNALIVAPEFDGTQFPEEAYQLGGVKRAGKVMPAEQWTFRFFAEIITEVRRREGRAGMSCHIIGHSAGGQILTRMAAFQPGGVTRIIAANPGSLVFPTRDLPFHYGFGGLPGELGGDEAIRRYLAAPFTLFLGTADSGTKNLDQSKKRDAAGGYTNRAWPGLLCGRARVGRGAGLGIQLAPGRGRGRWPQLGAAVRA